MTSAGVRRQLALPLPYEPCYGADFIAAGSNEEARAWLARGEAWPQRRLALWGETGTGKTHLLRLWAASAGAELASGAALRGLTGLPLRPIALDDADASADEPALLHLLNGAAEAGRPVLMAARAPPARWQVALPDLATRLRAILAVRIAPAEDDLLRALFLRLAAERHGVVPAHVQDWLMRRLPRTAAAVREAVARLDHAALAVGGRVTRALAAEELADLLGPPDRAPSEAADG